VSIAAAADSGSQVPITIVNGAQPGPVLALIAGVHGSEYAPIMALQKLRPQIDARKLRGTVVMVHAANLPSFLRRTIYYNPIDWKNLNRVFPGKTEGTFTERLAHFLTTNVIERCDYLVDIHCGDGNEALLSYVAYPVTGKARLDSTMAEMALTFGIERIVIVRRALKPDSTVYCSSTGAARGKPTLAIENGQLGMTDQDSIDRIVSGLQSLLRLLKMTEGQPLRMQNPTYVDSTKTARSPATGILYPKVKIGQLVKKDDILAIITNFFGETIAEVRAPMAGMVMYNAVTPPISAGETVASIGAVRKQ
jgi:predicted deacylase